MSLPPQLARTPEPPYYAVIFTSLRTEEDRGDDTMAQRMAELAARQPGFLGIESVRAEGLGITVSYWRNLDDIKNWKADTEHQGAQQGGKKIWYSDFTVRIARVEREYGKSLN